MSKTFINIHVQNIKNEYYFKYVQSSFACALNNSHYFMFIICTTIYVQ